ncbi:MAG: heme exporter protein CcmB [Thermoanaerobaculia bacterium]
MSSAWIAEAGALFAKEWRTELRGRHAISTLALFAVTTLVVLSLALGPVGVSREDRTWVAPVVLWILLLFSASLGLPRSFVREEESRTAIALRLAATPSALFAGKLLYTLTLLFALELLVAPLFLAALQIEVARWGLFGLALGLGGAGLAAASTLVAAIAAQGEEDDAVLRSGAAGPRAAPAPRHHPHPRRLRAGGPAGRHPAATRPV